MSNFDPMKTYLPHEIIDVWRVCIPGESGGCICDDEQEAREMAGEDPGAPLEVHHEKMPQGEFDALGEFDGF